ncbi:MAG: serine acetyltransferase, partial [Deltaproteobacteria bacterium]|nr:serine acetyltransferase [Deltaproteobacteria bacterium]
MKTTSRTETIEKKNLSRVVDNLCSPDNYMARTRSANRKEQILPSRNTLIELVEALRAVLFPGYFGPSELTIESLRFHVGSTLNKAQRILRQQVQRVMGFLSEEDMPDRARHEKLSRIITDDFLARLPEIQRILATDVQAAYERDPAAKSKDEAIFCYPG